MMMLKSFFRRIVKDFRHKELLPLKLIFFVQASTLYVLYPYLTIHMRELGINVEETAIMSAVTPIVAIIMPPLAGMAADRIGNFRILLSVFSSLGGGAALLLLLVPIGRVTVNFPERVVMDVACPGKGSDVVYTMSGSHPCETSLKSEISTRIESCGYECHVDTRNDTIAMALLASRLYTVNLYDSTSNTTSSFKYVATRDEIPQNISEDEDIREKRRLSNNEFFKTSVRRLSKNAYFFPTERLFEFACTPSGFVEDFEVPTSSIATSRIYENRTLCAFPRFPANLENKTEEPSSAHSYRSKLSSLSLTEKDRDEERRRYSLERISWNGGDFQKITCGNPDTRETVVTVPLFDYTGSLEPYEILRIEGCGKKCVLTAPRKDVCSNMKMEVEYNVSMTFWLYLVIRVFIGIISGTTFAMFEGAVIAILREEKADYGLQRIYGSIGGVISSPLSGFLIDYVSTGKPYTDFRPAFYLYAVLKIVSSIFMLTINLEFKAPATNVMKDVVAVLRNVEVVALFIACFVLGTAWGYIESFLFWLIQDLGGSRSLMGITITVGGIAGIPLLVLSGPIISKIGHANVLFVGFIFYAVRLFGYSLLYNPWMTLLFEALESVTSSLSFTAAVTYAAKLSTTTTDSSIQGLLGGVYYGVGKGSGSLIGGYLMKAFDTRPTYRIFAAICLTTGLMYFFFNVLYLKKRPHVEGNDIVKKKPKNTDDRNGLKKSPPEIVQDEKSKEKSIEMDRVDAKNGRISRDIEAFYNSKRLENGEKIPTNDTTSFEQSNREIEKLRMYDRTNYGFVHDESERCDVEDGESMRKKEITVVPGV